MAVGKTVRLSKLAREYNVGIHTIVEFLQKKNIEINSNPNTKVPAEAVALLEKEYKDDLQLKKESEKISFRGRNQKKETLTIEKSEEEQPKQEEEKPKEVKEEVKEEPKPVVEKKKEELFEVEREERKDIKVLDKIDLDAINKPKKKKQPKPVEVKEEKPKIEEEKKEKKPVAEEEKTAKPKPQKEEKTTTKKEEKNIEPSKEEKREHIKTDVPDLEEVKVVGKIDLSELNQKTRPDRKTKAEKEKERKERRKKRQQEKVASSKKGDSKKKNDEVIKTQVDKLGGPTIVGQIDLPKKRKKVASSDDDSNNSRKQRRRITRKGKVKLDKKGANYRGKKRFDKSEVSEEDVQKQIKETLARLTSKGKNKGAKYRKEKRAAISDKKEAERGKELKEEKILKVTEFVSVNELATMMSVDVTKVISACMSLGLFVSINQRLDAETLQIVAEEFGFKVEFVSVEIQEAIEVDEDVNAEENLEPRPPIITVMGHVDHGKTSLLDYIRNANVIAGEAGGITQHIGAYHVELNSGKAITFLDTPGHEAFTAMRARGAQVTDIAIIIVAADDDVMPQTIEAINHASAAGVPMVFAINKIDKPGANPEKIKEQLAGMNYLVEEWGGKYQSQDISAKKGEGIEELLEKVLLEAEMLDLKANPNTRATGTIIESSLDKGRGYVATVLVESGTLQVGDIILAGQHYGHVKALFNERNKRIKNAGPAEPAIMLGLNGAPQAGDKFHVLENEREARDIANKREQLAREQGLRTQKHVTLDEIGRRIAIGNFQELNLIVKGDVDGSVEALADSLIKLSTEEIQVNIKHKAVGQISESDILLAAASEAIIVGFQVRPSLSARKLAEKEEIDIRLYSIIYDAINEIKAAMEGMLSPDIKEEIIGTAEVLQTFKVSKVGTIAGCIVRDGIIKRNAQVRVIRDGIVIYTGNLESLKRLKDDVREVKNGYECGLNIEKFNDVKVGDNIESFEEVEVAKTL